MEMSLPEAWAAQGWPGICCGSAGDKQEPGLDVPLAVQGDAEPRKAMPACHCAPRDPGNEDFPQVLGLEKAEFHPELVEVDPKILGNSDPSEL